MASVLRQREPLLLLGKLRHRKARADTKQGGRGAGLLGLFLNSKTVSVTARSSLHCFYELFPKLLVLLSPPLDAKLGSPEGQVTRTDSLKGTVTSVG